MTYAHAERWLIARRFIVANSRDKRRILSTLIKCRLRRLYNLGKWSWIKLQLALSGNGNPLWVGNGLLRFQLLFRTSEMGRSEYIGACPSTLERQRFADTTGC